MRERKRRYMVIKALSSEGNVKKNVFVAEFKKALYAAYGLYGLSKIRFSVVEYFEDISVAIVATDNESVDLIRAALPLSRLLGAKNLLFCVKVCGTLKKAVAYARSEGWRVLKSLAESLG